MPAKGRPGEPGEDRGTEERLAALERAVEAMATEVRTRRLVVVDRDGEPRIVGELSRGTAELRLEAPDGGAPGARPSVVLYASPAPGAPDAGDDGLGPAVGLQIWADGDAVAQLDAWPEEDGTWGAHLFLESGGGTT